MKIIIKNSFGEYFQRIPEVGFTNFKNNAHIFNCINDEHAKIVLEKTKEFVSYNDLYLELLHQEIEIEKKKTEKS
jgi:hypothetical protein